MVASSSENRPTMDAFAVLGIARTGKLDIEEIKRRYRAACMRWHPDKNPGASKDVAERRFKEVQQAFRHLSVLASGGEEATRAVADEALARADEFMSQLDALDAAAQSPPDEAAAQLRIGDGILYVGEVESGQPHGFGELILKDGSVHRGHFDAGRAAGRGILYSGSGAVFEGSFVQNRRVGTFEVLRARCPERCSVASVHALAWTQELIHALACAYVLQVVDPKGERWCDMYDEGGERLSSGQGGRRPHPHPPPTRTLT